MRKGIANVFAEFHEDLYSSKNDERKDKQDSEAGPENTCDHADDDTILFLIKSNDFGRFGII